MSSLRGGKMSLLLPNEGYEEVTIINNKHNKVKITCGRCKEKIASFRAGKAHKCHDKNEQREQTIER